jgi:predicted ATPase/DNA-binding CsgD family transcriptional regulator
MTVRERHSVELTSFIGRERTLERLMVHLSPDSSERWRLVTLSGPGGSGKTRLALRLLELAAGRYRDGTCFVALASIADPRLVFPTIAQTVGVREVGGISALAGLKSYLKERQLLLVLDNFEHVLGAAVDLPELLLACARLQVVVTSRASLRISGERELAVDPLEPDEAVRLFADRATAVNAAFAITTETQPVVAEICRRLDGLPLAIELAAARARVLDLSSMLNRLEHRLHFLTGGPRDLPARQQTLRSTIAWSYELLEPHEQAVFRAAAVFSGGCTLEALQAVAGDRVDPLDAVDALVARSLLRVRPSPPGGVRYGLLETTREFGLEQLAWSGELEPLRQRHAEYFLALAQRAEPEAWGRAAGTWHTRVETEHDNLRAALDWGLARGADQGKLIALRTAAALGRFWWTRAHFVEGLEWLARTLAPSPARTADRMKALHAAGWLAHFQHDSQTARAYLDESLSIACELGDGWTETWVTFVLGRLAYFDFDPAGTQVLAERTLALAEKQGDPYLIAWAFHLQGLAAHIAHDYESADRLYCRSMEIREALGQLEQIGVLSQLMGMAAQRRGDHSRALELYRRFMQIARELGSTFHLSLSLALFGTLAAANDQPQRGAELLGAASVFHEASHTRAIPLTEELVEEAKLRVIQALGEPAFSAALAAGRAISSEAAIEQALAVTVAVHTAPTRPLGPLSIREQEVAALVSRGLTNRQIAAELFVTERTIGAHVEHILNKLSFTSRTQIGVWFAAQSG